MQAFDGAPFTATMLHSRLVTMRWRLAFTPIYALLSERGGNSITICPLLDVRASDRPDSQLLAELEAPDNPQEQQPSMIADTSSSLQTSQKQTVDTRVLLSVSVVQDAIHDVSHWVSWLTTAAPWDVTRANVKVESIFRSHSTLILVSIPTCAWSRLPERPAYQFVGFIRSGNLFGLQSSSEAQSTHHRHKRQGIDVVPQPAAKMPRRSPRFPSSEYHRTPSTAALGLEETPKSKGQSAEWSSEDDELLMWARLEGLNWQPIASLYFPNKTSNACRKRHERLMEEKAGNKGAIDSDKTTKRVGKNWQADDVRGFSIKST